MLSLAYMYMQKKSEYTEWWALMIRAVQSAFLHVIFYY